MKIVLLRHGRTNLPPWPWITARELGRWIAAYNRAGIQDMPPPAAAMAVAGQCKVIVTSDLLRSVESGMLLGSKTQMISDGLFREAGLPYGPAFFVRMPPYVWAVLFRFLWSFGFKANGESIHAFRKRARSAANLLISLARKHDSVLLVGHGLINSHLARELLSAGWNGHGKTKICHWGYTEYIREAPGFRTT
jgi:broad specificity phosphatase PhoE